jgi:hypothetical protein
VSVLNTFLSLLMGDRQVLVARSENGYRCSVQQFLDQNSRGRDVARFVSAFHR